MNEAMAQRALTLCRARGHGRSWSDGGCYLHLEASEFIEALRGKGDDPPAKEAADILFVLLSTCAHHGIPIPDVMEELKTLLL